MTKMSYSSLYQNVTAPMTYHGLENAVVSYLSVSRDYHAETAPLRFEPREITRHYSHSFSDLLYKVSEQVIYSAGHGMNKEYAFIPDDFLKPGRVPQPFVLEASHIEFYVKEAFHAVVGTAFPSDIRISVLDESEFRTLAPDPSCVGLSLNRKESGLVSDVFILAAPKDKVLLTAGHEIGHVLSRSLSHKHNEEAKAFAFTRAWMAAIKRHNIAGLGESIMIENPARNGLHDVAFAFVMKLISAGKDALDLYWELVKGNAEVEQCPQLLS